MGPRRGRSKRLFVLSVATFLSLCIPYRASVMRGAIDCTGVVGATHETFLDKGFSLLRGTTRAITSTMLGRFSRVGTLGVAIGGPRTPVGTSFSCITIRVRHGEGKITM